MDTTILKRFNWFWPWQDEKEEAWLEKMSQDGWHLKSVSLPCVYTFGKGDPRRYTYRLDYMPTEKGKFQEYLQIFRDAGWEYLGELSNWRYWRKLDVAGETSEIFTDTESILRKYRRLLGYMGFFLALMVFLGMQVFRDLPGIEAGPLTLVSAIYMFAKLIYAVLIPIYVVVIVQLLRRIDQLKKKNL
jgi:hypothetical protein